MTTCHTYSGHSGIYIYSSIMQGTIIYADYFLSENLEMKF